MLNHLINDEPFLTVIVLVEADINCDYVTYYGTLQNKPHVVLYFEALPKLTLNLCYKVN